jgi:YVTN family beta-propeller protein
MNSSFLLLPALLPILLLAGTVSASTPLVVEKEGARLELRVTGDNGRLMDGEAATVELRISDVSSGQPLRGLRPAAWIDNRGVLAHPGGREASCRERVGAYLKGNVGSRPLIDLNGHYLLVLNRDPTISVIDPIVGISGRTNLFTNILLPQPGADWTEHRQRRRLLVTLPRANQVALIDSETFKINALLNTGREPVRVVSQQSGPLAFTGNNGDATVSVLDLASGKPLTTIAVGKGHHELQLVESANRLFVSNRTDQTLSVIDTTALNVLRTLPLSGTPSALAHSAVAEAVYIAAGREGRVLAFNARSGEAGVQAHLGSPVDGLYATPDGRTLLALATDNRQLFVLDAADLSIRHRITLPGAPFQIAFTGEYAHIRMYDTERVTLLPLSAINASSAPVLGGYTAGTGAPRRESVAVMAPTLAATPDGMAAVVVNPADGQLHYYMEGMNATAGSFRNYGHPPQAVRVTERALAERAPGTYVAQLRLPAAGTLSLALRLEQPRLAECFDFEVSGNASLEPQKAKLQSTLEPLAKPMAGEQPQTVRIRITNENGKIESLPAGAQLRYYRAPGTDRRTATLRSAGDGVYEAELLFNQPGAYYLQIDAAATLSPPFLSLHIRGD